jgi:hypothetical protein
MHRRLRSGIVQCATQPPTYMPTCLHAQTSSIMDRPMRHTATHMHANMSTCTDVLPTFWIQGDYYLSGFDLLKTLSADTYHVLHQGTLVYTTEQRWDGNVSYCPYAFHTLLPGATTAYRGELTEPQSPCNPSCTETTRNHVQRTVALINIEELGSTCFGGKSSQVSMVLGSFLPKKKSPSGSIVSAATVSLSCRRRTS